MLADCGMVEFPYKGNPMSWMGYRSSGKVQCRLNRAIGNEEWHHLFFHTNAEYLKLWGSDHGPILIRTQSQTVRLRRSFKFDRRWLDKDGLKEAIEEGWGPREVMDTRPLHIKLGDVRRAISRWKRANPSNTQKKIELIKEQLERAQADEDVTNEELLNLKWNLCTAFREVELYWRQKSRALWLKDGDMNTKFFHAITKQRRARNRITKLKKPGGGWAESEESIEKVATEYFQNLFTSSQASDFEEALRYITVKVSPAMNEMLTSTPTDGEIKKAIDHINPDKAPGPDGMTGLFYQQNWEVTAKEIIAMVKKFFISNVSDPRLNQTNICLIPKSEKQREMSEFRLSLCNVSYKIISKILCSRLKKIFPKLISETQSAFVAKRLISDNILLAQEAFHALRTNPMCKAKFVAIKTDMSKKL